MKRMRGGKLILLLIVISKLKLHVLMQYFILCKENKKQKKFWKKLLISLKDH